mmetsp:Transcript_3150/g.8228  ORF Transcript_3150/g.8228 Transcript_3150/m.8228 type:complete len:456 (-) Transcript_3150:158-1525(-)
MASSAAASLIRRKSAAVIRQRWSWPLAFAPASHSSGGIGERAASSISTDCSALDGWLPAAQYSSRGRYCEYPLPSNDALAPRIAGAYPSAFPQTRSQLPPVGAASFSTKAADEEDHVEDGGHGDEEVEDDEEPQPGDEPSKMRKIKKPSILLQLPQTYTPAMAYDVITSHHPPRTTISRRDLRLLCLSARPGVKKDGKKIAQALRDFRRCNNLEVDSVGSRVAMEGMVRAWTPEGASAEQKALAVVLALEKGWVDVKGTGVYYAYPTKGVDHWLETLLSCLRESKGEIRLPEGFDHTTDMWPKRKDTDGGGDDEADPSDLFPVRLLRTVQQTVHLLIQRGSHPDRMMKKRAGRKYRKALCLTPEEGNATQLTVHLGVQIALELGGTSKCARDCALTKFREKRNKDLEETGKLVIEKYREERAAELAEAVATEEADSESESSMEGEENEGEDENNS